LELIITDRSGRRSPFYLDDLHRYFDSVIDILEGKSPMGAKERHLAELVGWWSVFFRIFTLEIRLRHDTIHEPPFLFGLEKLLEVSFGQVRPP